MSAHASPALIALQPVRSSLMHPATDASERASSPHPHAAAAAAEAADEPPSPSNSAHGSSGKRVSFALGSSSASRADLSESLLASSFTSSDSLVAPPLDAASATAHMSLERLRGTSQPSYSSLSQHDDDDDLPPPLEAVEHGGHGHSHGSNGHGHSHSSSELRAASASPTECDHVAHRTGRTHSHSHGGRHRNASKSPASPRSPNKRSPIDNCGGLRDRLREQKMEDDNRKARRQLGWATLFCCLFMIGEVIGGFVANSLAIMTDAAHLLSDLAGMLISIFALWLASRPATSRLSFGFHRAEILGALISVVLIWLLTGILLYEACWRLAHPEPVDGKIMFIVATCGLLANGAMGLILVGT